MLALIYPDPQFRRRYESLPVLGRHWDGLCQWLDQHGYPLSAIRRRIQSGPFLEYTFRRRGICSLEGLTFPELRSLTQRRPSRWTEQIADSLVRSLADYLEDRGELTPVNLTPTSELVGQYRRHLELVRGLSPSTVTRDCISVAEFLDFLNFDESPGALSALQVGTIDSFMTKLGRRLGRASMVKAAAKLRAFLRYLAQVGKTPPGLDAQVESARCYRGELLPRALPWKKVCAIIRLIDRTTPKGCRDYAMLLMIAVYGLRAGEIAALLLDSICWRSREIAVPRPKIGTPLLLPLTDEVANALIEYLRRVRGTASSCRHLFLRLRVPSGPIKYTAVSDAFDVWAQRAGCQFVRRAGGPHCLRHSLAVHLVQQGTSMKTIGALLGHASSESTGVYLRLKVEDLRDVALPLPKRLQRGGC